MTVYTTWEIARYGVEKGNGRSSLSSVRRNLVDRAPRSPLQEIGISVPSSIDESGCILVEQSISPDMMMLRLPIFLRTTLKNIPWGFCVVDCAHNSSKQ